MSRRFIQTTQAASLLNLCPQRVRKLLSQGRIRGAFKDKKGFWQIPLYWGVPQVIPAERGQEGTWRKRFVKRSTFIHVRQDRLRHKTSIQIAMKPSDSKEGIGGVWKKNSVKIFSSRLPSRTGLTKHSCSEYHRS